MIKRQLRRIEKPQGQPGFLGAGHTARQVVQGGFYETDPFIIMMDDVLDKKDNEPVGGPHPHAGFETVTLMLEGEIGDGTHTLKKGDFQLMTAGAGVVHTETIDKSVRMRLLQLWLNLPRKDRAAKPRLQGLPVQHVPEYSNNGVTIKVYSGSLAGVISPVKNYTPLIVADVTIQPGLSTALELPANYNGFLYVIDGAVVVGDEQQLLAREEVGWLNRFDEDALSSLGLKAGEEGVRLVLYAGKPSGDTIISHGPFIADSTDDINRLYREYRQGKLRHIATVPAEQRMMF